MFGNLALVGVDVVERVFPEHVFAELLTSNNRSCSVAANGRSGQFGLIVTHRSDGPTCRTVTPPRENLHMAAVIDLHTGARLAPEARRPQLRLIHGGASRSGPSSTVSQRTYVLRRAVVAALAVVVVLFAAQVVAGIGRVIASELAAVPASSGQVHVVSPGESAWELAGRYAPSLDRRDAVDQLLALNGQGPLRIGQELRLPASFD